MRTFLGILYYYLSAHLQDNNTDFNEVFGVQILSVQLIEGDQNYKYNPPSVDPSSSLVQVIITESVQANGIISFGNTTHVSVREDVGTLRIPVFRVNGMDSTVGAYYRIQFQNATTADIGHVSGVVTFDAGESRSEINLTIVNDGIPEFRETFIVELTKPVGGATIGDRRTVDVIIKENDYPFGLFRCV